MNPLFEQGMQFYRQSRKDKAFPYFCHPSQPPLLRHIAHNCIETLENNRSEGLPLVTKRHIGWAETMWFKGKNRRRIHTIALARQDRKRKLEHCRN